jgi:hypothetical protein
MSFKNFLGKDGFFWWVGVVENRMDPLALGRCQVRIFGWHHDGGLDSKQRVPVTDLPWATPLYPCNTGTKTFGTPELGDWVVGFFFDGQAGQFPVMMGVLPGFNPTEEDKAKSVG